MEIKGMEIKRVGVTGTEIIKMDKQEIIKDIEMIEQRLTSLQLTMELLATHVEVIQVFTTDDLNSLNIPTDVVCEHWDKVRADVVCEHWDKVRDGCNLHKLICGIAINSSEELSSICYEKLDELKKVIKDVM